MSWTRKDWIDLLLMVLGAIIGVAIFGFGLAPFLGLEFGAGHFANYMFAAISGTLGGYAIRFGVSRLRSH